MTPPSGKDPSETAKILNRYLEKISTWADKWKVKFNSDKSSEIIFSNKLGKGYKKKPGKLSIFCG